MTADKKHYWVYILLCSNNTYYTGYTNDLNKRYQSHVNGTGKCKYTRSFKPICIAQSWQINGNKAQAMKVERCIKKLSHSEKKKIIAEPLNFLARVMPDHQNEQ
ncbi:GIY-YIG nuclease family protein [Legionella drancourtii]|nr:GIY-YIG nuclease family protein [Legionella drancourtii]